MCKKLTTEQFIEKGVQKYGNKFDYSKAKYVNNKTKLIIICPIHSEFSTTPTHHLKKYRGCQLCRNESLSKKKTFTKEDFVQKAIGVHGENKYSCDKTDYTNSRTKAIITCLEHGDFVQLLNQHLQGRNCPACAKNNMIDKKKLDEKETIDRLNLLFNGKFDYSKTIIDGVLNRVIIKCIEHNVEFSKRLYKHIEGHVGCPHCIKENRYTKGFSRGEWINFCKNKNVEYPTTYIVKLTDGNESFIKIGITTNTTQKRMQGIAQYKFETLNEIIGKPEAVYDLENKLHKAFKKYKYNPLINFGGETECFSLDILQDSNFQMFLKN